MSSARLSGEQAAALGAAVGKLKATPGVVGITGDCSLFVHYEADVASHSTPQLPCFQSSMVQAAFMAALYTQVMMTPTHHLGDVTPPPPSPSLPDHARGARG